VIDEVKMYRAVAVAFLVSLPVAFTLMALPAKTLKRQRFRWIAIGYIGIGTCFIGFSASWPGPNSVTTAMMLGGLVTFVGSAYFLVRSFLRPHT